MFGIVIVLSAYMSFFINGINISESTFGQTLSENAQTYIQYGLIVLGIIPIITGAFDINVIERKYSRILQILCAIVLFWYSAVIIGGAKL